MQILYKAKQVVKLVYDPDFRFSFLDDFGFYNFMNDKKYLERKFYMRMGRKLDLSNPQTFNEKLQWLKLYDRNPLYTTLVDKYSVKDYVASKIGDEYIIPTLGIWDKFEDIKFDSLPDKFVLKCTHDSGGLVICKDKKEFNYKSAKKKFNKNLKHNFYYVNREWPYKNVKSRIIAEKYMEDKKTNELRDYKFYCFNGKVQALLVATNRQNKNEELNFDYFDIHFNHLDWINHWHPNAKNTPQKPENFEKMVELARKISKGFPHVRVDFYVVNGNIFFGELTFYDQGGYLKICPEYWEKEWGDLIDLSLAYSMKHRSDNSAR